MAIEIGKLLQSFRPKKREEVANQILQIEKQEIKMPTEIKEHLVSALKAGKNASVEIGRIPSNKSFYRNAKLDEASLKTGTYSLDKYGTYQITENNELCVRYIGDMRYKDIKEFKIDLNDSGFNNFFAGEAGKKMLRGAFATDALGLGFPLHDFRWELYEAMIEAYEEERNSSK